MLSMQHYPKVREKRRSAKQLPRRREKQLSLLNDKVPRLFGGSLLKGHAKRARPLSTKEPIHLVLKSEQAIGPRSMLRPHNAKKIEVIVRYHAKASGITIYQLVNVGNHLHIVLRITNLFLYDRFIRSVTGLIARHVTNRERGEGRKFLSLAQLMKTESRGLTAQSDSRRFWQARPFTRLIAWGRDYTYIKNYMDKNRDQANPRQYFIAWGFDSTNANRIEYLNTG